MSQKQLLTETDLAALAKRLRKKAGKTRAEAGRDMGVSHVSIHRAEEDPSESLLRLRLRMIEAYSQYRVVGPLFLLEPKKARTILSRLREERVNETGRGAT